MDIEHLKKYHQIYVIGHQTPDVDTVFSSYLMNNILRYLGVNSNYAFLKDGYDLALDEKDVIVDFFKLEPVIIKNEETKDKNFFLVDHNRVFNSIKDGNVVGGIDHHFNPYHNYPNFEIGDYASTGAYIYDKFKNIYPFSQYEKELVALTILMDTKFLRTTRYKDIDKKVYEELGVNFDVLELIKKYFKTTNFNSSIEDNFKLRFKAYEVDNIIINTTYVNALQNNYSLLEKYVQHMNNLEGNWILIWNEYDTLKTYVYIKINNINNYLEYNFIASRANDVIRDVKKLLFK